MNKPTLVIFLTVLATSCNQPRKESHTDKAPAEKSPASVIPVVVTQVSTLQQARQSQASLSGSVESAKTVDVGFTLPGRVTQVYVREGQLIRKGQVLARQEATSFQFSLQAAKATLAQAQDAFNRASIMNDRGSLAPVDFQKVLTALEQAKAAYGQAEKNVNDTELLAPLSGILAKLSVETGEQVTPGVTPFSIVKINPIDIIENIPEAEINHYKNGQVAQVEIPALQMSFTGKITEIGISADPATRAFRMKVSVPNPGGKIRPGMIATVNFSAKSTLGTPTLTLPAELILHEPDNTSFVYVADPQKKVASKRIVKVGAFLNNQVEIISGLAHQELIVTAGQQKLHDGSVVSFKSAQE